MTAFKTNKVNKIKTLGLGNKVGEIFYDSTPSII